MTTRETLIVERKGPVLHVAMNRPKALNALNGQLLNELTDVCREAAADAAIRVLVLGGAGGKAFAAGADIAEMARLDADQALAFARFGQALTTLLASMPCVTVARVEGYALGGGCELAMACDIVVAAPNAVFGQPEVDLGLVPGFGGTQRLVRRVGQPVAMAMLVAGKKLSAQEAFQLGLVSMVTGEDVDADMDKIVKGILKAGPRAVKETKILCEAATDMPLGQGLAREAHVFANCFAHEEAREGMAAFLEKRRPYFFSGN